MTETVAENSRPQLSKLMAIWWTALAVKILLGLWLPFSSDEAYYWVWGHHPQLSYYDHPPMVGWLFTLGSLFENFGNGARLPGICLGHLTLLIWNKLLEPFMDDKQRVLWLIVMVLSPFFGIGSLIITPDTPLVFFWSASLYMLFSCVSRASAINYMLLGLLLGLGFCSKYLIVIFVPVSLIWVVFGGYRKQVNYRYLPLTVLVGLLACTPVIYWNWQHEWASFSFQLEHGLGRNQPATFSLRSLQWPLDYLLGQLMLIFPPVLILALSRREPKPMRCLHYFGWLPILFFLYTSFSAHVEANWPVMAHPAIYALAVANTTTESQRRWLKGTCAIWLLALIAIVSEVAYPWIPLSPKKLKTNEFKRFDVFLPYAEQKQPFYAGSYQMAATLSYKLKRQIYKVARLNRVDFYDFQPNSFPNDDSFWLGTQTGHQPPFWLLQKGYEVVSSKRLTDEYSILEVKRRAKDSDR